jgi:hypothetical protein
MDLHEIPDLFTQPIPYVPVWRDGRYDRGYTVAVEQLALISQPQKVGLDLLATEAQRTVKLLTNPAGVQHLYLQAASVKGIADGTPNG